MRRAAPAGLVLALLLVSPASRGMTVVRQLSWVELVEKGQVPEGALEGDRLLLSNRDPRPRTFQLFTIDAPEIHGPRWALIGELRSRDVQGEGYLEMWSVFDSGRHFSRTLASSGPTQSIRGSSAWRPLALPFSSKPGAPPPRRLEVNLVLPGRGTVELGPLALVELGENEDLLATVTQRGWWSDREGGWLGGIAGSFLGLIAAAIAMLTWLGRARQLAVGLALFVVGIGAVALGVGAFAAIRSQPYAVYYPLLLLGGLAVVLMALALPVIRRRYRDAGQG